MLGGSLCLSDELLNVSLQLLVASLGLIAAALSIFQADLQGDHMAVICLQSGLELCHFGPQLLVFLLQAAQEGTIEFYMYGEKPER